MGDKVAEKTGSVFVSILPISSPNPVAFNLIIATSASAKRAHAASMLPLQEVEQLGQPKKKAARKMYMSKSGSTSGKNSN